MASSPLAARVLPASVWTGSEMIVWGGTDPRRTQFFGDGAAYNPTTNSWRVLPRAPIEPRAALSVWSGDEFIVWGSVARDKRFRDGAAYNPRTDTWRNIQSVPIDLTDAEAVWTGKEMLVFGAALHGGNVAESKTALGAAYDPRDDEWRRLPASELSPQASTAAWNGNELIAWDYLNSSQAYDPTEDRWENKQSVPIDAGECFPHSVAIRRDIFGAYCGFMAVYSAQDGAWHKLPRDFVQWQVEPVAAPPVILLLGRNAETDDAWMLAYRAPTW